MSRDRIGLGFLLLLATAGGCATARPEAATPAVEMERTINTLRAKNNSYVRQIEDLQNRVFILEDRLDSQRVADQQRMPPTLPAVKVLRKDPLPPSTVVVQLPPEVIDPPAPLSAADAPPSELVAADAPVEYVGEAARPAPGRPVLRADRPPTAPHPPAPSVVRAARPAPAVAATAPPPTLPPTLVHEGAEPREAIPPEPLRVYRDALEALRAGHHAAALSGFRRFLDHYPVHDYADNAQYWIGECYYDLRQYQAATREFRAVIERYPHGNKVPDAMLKLAFSHLAAGQTTDGRQVLESLVRAFPKHTTATLAAARLREPPFGTKSEGGVTLGTIAPLRVDGARALPERNPSREGPGTLRGFPDRSGVR